MGMDLQWLQVSPGIEAFRCTSNKFNSTRNRETDLSQIFEHNQLLHCQCFPGDEVPDYICSLPYLETLELPVLKVLIFSQKSISRMKQLSYVDVGIVGFRILVDDDQREIRGGNVDMDTLPNLQSVQSIVVDKHTASILPKFPNLTELRLFDDEPYIAKSEMEEALASLGKNQRYLQRLGLCYFRDYNLRVLPPTLTKLTLYESESPNMMKTLGKLPNLLWLQIENTHQPKSLDLCVGVGEFPQLQVFELIENRINSWEMDRDGMPNLQRLIIINRFFKREIDLPDQLWFLRALRFVKINVYMDVAKSFRNKLWELTYVKEEIVGEFKTNWELTMINGCKVSLSAWGR